jgi:hypothetical protein
VPGAAVLILHRVAPPGAGPLEQWLANSRAALAEHQRLAFLAAGAAIASIVAGPPDDTPFGARLRRLVEAERPSGLVVLGSGSIPLSTDADRRAFVSVAAGGLPLAMTNNRYSGDVVAVGRAEVLRTLPDLVSDNALPRWLADVCGIEVLERRSARLGVDIDAPLDLVLVGDRGRPKATIPAPPADVDLGPVRLALAGARAAAADPRAELLISGRTSAATLAWLERNVAARVRALVEERGLRSATVAGVAGTPPGFGVNRRPPRSILGALLEHDGPAGLVSIVASVADAAILDSRVLLAHRLGADERGWPRAEDRFASDLLLPEGIEDPWLRELTTAVRDSRVPIVLGGHTLVGPGLRLALRGTRR